MALIPKVTFKASSETTTGFTLEDTTGVYNATTNAGGYGAPNAIRSTLAVQLFIYRDYESATDLVIAIDNTSADTQTEWIVPTTVGGFGLYGKAAIVAPIWVAGAYNANDVVWESGVLYHVYTAGPVATQPSTDAANWRPDTDALFPITDMISNPGTYTISYLATINHVYTNPLDTGLADKLSDLNTAPKCNSDLRKDITNIKFYLDSVDIFSFAGDYLSAERSAQLANDLLNKQVCF